MNTIRRHPHPLLIAGVALWLTAVFVAPLAAAEGWRVAPWLYAAFHFVCHQIPERSFFLGEHPLAACHRCTGLYVGGLLGLLALPWLSGFRRWLTDEPKRMLWCVLPLLIDVALPMNAWWSRFATGVFAAVPVALVLWLALDQILAPRERDADDASQPTTGRLEVAEWEGKP